MNAMKCRRCGRPLAASDRICRHCGEMNAVAKLSTILISAGQTAAVYRSVKEVPAPLRRKLLKSTNGTNSATILIADQRGRKEIARAMKNLPGPAQKRLMHSILGAEAGSRAFGWLTPARKRAIVAGVAVVTMALITLVFTHRW